MKDEKDNEIPSDTLCLILQGRIKELRTRVAEQGKKIKEQNEYIEDDDSVLCQQRNEADAQRRKAENQCHVLASENDIYKEKMDELQNRLSTLEKELNYSKKAHVAWAETATSQTEKIMDLKSKLSTVEKKAENLKGLRSAFILKVEALVKERDLYNKNYLKLLKASEGMAGVLNKLIRPEVEGVYDASEIFEANKEAKALLADFRAVKERK